MVGANPGGAGKTTVMGALLNFVPAEVALCPATPQAMAAGREAKDRRCYICHEISPSSVYYCYLWGAALREYFCLFRF